MGSIGRDQQIWVQILVQATGERFKTPNKWFKRHDWKDEGAKTSKNFNQNMDLQKMVGRENAQQKDNRKS